MAHHEENHSLAPSFIFTLLDDLKTQNKLTEDQYSYLLLSFTFPFHF